MEKNLTEFYQILSHFGILSQDGLIQEKNTALRDLSARCLREFLKWSLKQTSKKVKKDCLQYHRKIYKQHVVHIEIFNAVEEKWYKH